MKKSILAASLLLCSASAMAHEDCDVDIDGELSLINDVLTVTTENQDVVTIVDGKALSVNGKSVTLDDQQAQWLSQYYHGVYSAVPAVADIALDGVAIASAAVTEVLGGMLGADAEAIDELSAKLDAIRSQIRYKFYADDGSIHLEPTNFEDGASMGKQWEGELEQAIEEVVSASVGHLMIALGTQMLFGGEAGDDLEERVDGFADDIEQRVEQQALALEQKADALCDQMVRIDDAENNLQASVSELANFSMIDVRQRHSQM